MREFIFSWAESLELNKMVHIDSVPNGLNCGCICPHCKEKLLARHGSIRTHGFAHHSDNRGANLKICYLVTLYKFAEQIIQQEKKITVPSYYGIFKSKEIEFSEITIDSRYDRIDKQPDVIAISRNGEKYLIEFTFAYKIQRKKKIDYKNLNCLEVDLSGQTLESLQDFILYSEANRTWLNNDTYFNSIEFKYKNIGKSVKIVNENNCNNCELKLNCCGVRQKGSFNHLTIENNGETYRICKTDKFIELRKQIEDNNKRIELQEQLYERERIKQSIQYNLQINDHPHSNTKPRNDENKPFKHSESVLSKKNIPKSTQLSCFLCKRNLEWACRDHKHARCGIYESMNVPKNTPPESAKTCRGFILKDDTV